MEPRWTNTIRLSELPWLADHKIQGDILFPGAGMLCAALEGIQQLVDEEKTVHSFEFRDVSLHRALVIPSDGEDIQIMLSLKAHKGGAKATEIPWYDFAVYSLTKAGEHSEHCSGMIQSRYVAENAGFEEQAEDQGEWNRLKEEYADCQRTCVKETKPREFYDKWYTHGMQFGTFYNP